MRENQGLKFIANKKQNCLQLIINNGNTYPFMLQKRPSAALKQVLW